MKPKPNIHPTTGKPCEPILALASETGSVDEASVEVELASGEVITASSLSQLKKNERYGEILATVTAGQVFELRLSADIFSDKSNMNFIRPMPGDLDGVIERTSPDGPILTDHIKSSASHVGFIQGLSRVPVGGVDKLRARLGFRDPSAQSRTLRGLVRGFSIGWDGEHHECSICASKLEKGYFGMYPTCEHVRGQKYDGKTAEIYTSKAYLNEVSTTPFPASPGTRVRGPKLDNTDMGIDPESTDATEKTVTDEQKKILELEAEVTALKTTLADANSKVESSNKFGRELMFAKLQAEHRLTPADTASTEVVSVLSLGLPAAYAVLSRFPVRPELATSTASGTAADATTTDPAEPSGKPPVTPSATKQPSPGDALSYLRSIGAIQPAAVAK